ncbi:hypothetical protein [Solidesulfovibrio alcoholivorans]|uniref:hypothetical protein n=1 Tax=Solidesulfovibrio alcoholivorans TaxID=81406 RepID=UPI000A53C333|nr:hypothetical protein [Solidesulfovibrio alcoholivorans]
MKNNLSKLYITRVTDEQFEEIEKLRNKMGLSKSGIARALFVLGIQSIKNNLCM